MVREKNDIDIEDGSDETMLPIGGIGDGDKEKLATPHEEVKFIQVNDQNGDAKIDIGTVKVILYLLLINYFLNFM